jgi:hypothetical protein
MNRDRLAVFFRATGFQGFLAGECLAPFGK